MLKLLKLKMRPAKEIGIILLVLLCLPKLASEVHATDEKPAKPNSVKPKPAKAKNSGVVEGTVTYTADPKRKWRYARYYVDKKNKNRLAETLVCLRGIRTDLGSLAPPKKNTTALVDQKNFRFVPEILAIQSGDHVKFSNSDPGTHNVNSTNRLRRFDVTIAYGQEATETFSRAGGSRRPIVLGCKFHGSMRAWIYVFDHPWHQVTAKDGRFRLKDIPPGTYRLEVVHPAGKLRQTKIVVVRKGKTRTHDISLSPDDLLDVKKKS